MEKLYEVEIERNNVTPRQFFSYCKRKMIGKGADITAWVDSYETWANPTAPEESHTNSHENWDVPLIETIKYMPDDMHLYLQNNYNFIMEFEFDEDKKAAMVSILLVVLCADEAAQPVVNTGTLNH